VITTYVAALLVLGERGRAWRRSCAPDHLVGELTTYSSIRSECLGLHIMRRIVLPQAMRVDQPTPPTGNVTILDAQDILVATSITFPELLLPRRTLTLSTSNRSAADRRNHLLLAMIQRSLYVWQYYLDATTRVSRPAHLPARNFGESAAACSRCAWSARSHRRHRFRPRGLHIVLRAARGAEGDTLEVVRRPCDGPARPLRLR